MLDGDGDTTEISASDGTSFHCKVFGLSIACICLPYENGELYSGDVIYVGSLLWAKVVAEFYVRLVASS